MVSCQMLLSMLCANGCTTVSRAMSAFPSSLPFDRSPDRLLLRDRPQPRVPT